MSLKGYQWLNDNGEVVMSYLFKEEIIDVWKEVSEEEIQKFKDYIGMEILGIEYHYKEEVA